MRAYLAGEYAIAVELRDIRDRLVAAGHEVTSRWIDLTGVRPPDAAVWKEDGLVAAAIATEDLEDIGRADTLILTSRVPYNGRGGAHTEFGVALGSGKRLILLGPATNLFHWLPQVERHHTLHTLLVAEGERRRAPRQRLPEPERKPLPIVLDQGGQAPSQGYPDDAGWDLYVSQAMTIPPGEFADVPMGVRVELPPGVWGFLTGRSGTVRRKRLLVTNGVIDTGWRGELFAGVENIGDQPSVLEAGERIAQLILLPALSPLYRPTPVEALAPSARGTNGFGSTGV